MDGRQTRFSVAGVNCISGGPAPPARLIPIAVLAWEGPNFPGTQESTRQEAPTMPVWRPQPKGFSDRIG